MPTVDLSTASWRKSSRSSNTSDCVEVAFETLAWRKSSRSTNQANCVEVAFPQQAVAVRDSKAPTSGALVVPTNAWANLLTTLRWVNSCGRRNTGWVEWLG